MRVNLIQYGITVCSAQWNILEKGAVYHRLYYVYDGDAWVKDKEKSSALKSGYLYLFPINSYYHIFHNPNKPLKCLWFHIAFFPPIINGIIEQPVYKGTAIYHLIKTLEYLIKNKEKDKELLTQLLESLSLLINREEAFQYINDERLEKVLCYIHSHFMDNLNNDILAEQVRLNKNYFIHLFKKHFGVSPQRYVSSYRMGQACMLLKENIPVQEVAVKVGYNDPKAFSRSFHKVLGISPSEYSKRKYSQP